MPGNRFGFPSPHQMDAPRLETAARIVVEHEDEDEDEDESRFRIGTSLRSGDFVQEQRKRKN